MRRFLTSTTALSVALAYAVPLPISAQVLTAEGYVVAADGSVLCEPTADAPCDPANFVDAARAVDDALAAEAAAAAEAEAAAAAQAEADAAAAAAAQAEADAAAAAQAEADAAAAAQAEADAAAAAQADADAAAAAQAEADAAAAAQADADAAAAAQSDADAAAAAQADADAAAAAQADADAAAAAAAQAEADAAAAAQADADAAAAAQADADAADAAAALPAAPATGEAAVDPAAPVELTAEEQAAKDAADAEAKSAAEAELVVAPDGTLADPAADLSVAAPEPEVAPVPVEILVPSETEVETLSEILVDPAVLDVGSVEAVAVGTETPLAEGTLPTDAAPAPDAEVTTEVLTEADIRTSEQEFTAAPVDVSAGKRSGLSNLEKVGLIALGALVVGAIINEGKKDERRVVSNTGDRIVVLKPDGTYQVYKDDDAVLRQPGSTVRTETFRDGSTRTIVEREDGSQIVTIRDASGRVLRRAQYDSLGRELVLIDDLRPEVPVVIRDLPRPPRERVTISTSDQNAALKAQLAANAAAKTGRSFSLRQIREIPEVRALAATIDVDNITFDSGSAAIKAEEAENLADLGSLISELIAANPGEMFLIEGHTDAVGSAPSNLSLSDRRAESVALALTEYFDVPPENLVVQGYGEAELRVETLGDERRNRRVAVRIITPLM